MQAPLTCRCRTPAHGSVRALPRLPAGSADATVGLPAASAQRHRRLLLPQLNHRIVVQTLPNDHRGVVNSKSSVLDILIQTRNLHGAPAVGAYAVAWVTAGAARHSVCCSMAVCIGRTVRWARARQTAAGGALVGDGTAGTGEQGAEGSRKRWALVLISRGPANSVVGSEHVVKTAPCRFESQRHSARAHRGWESGRGTAALSATPVPITCSPGCSWGGGGGAEGSASATTPGSSPEDIRFESPPLRSLPRDLWARSFPLRNSSTGLASCLAPLAPVSIAEPARLARRELLRDECGACEAAGSSWGGAKVDTPVVGDAITTPLPGRAADSGGEFHGRDAVTRPWPLGSMYTTRVRSGVEGEWRAVTSVGWGPAGLSPPAAERGRSELETVASRDAGRLGPDGGRRAGGWPGGGGGTRSCERVERVNGCMAAFSDVDIDFCY